MRRILGEGDWNVVDGERTNGQLHGIWVLDLAAPVHGLETRLRRYRLQSLVPDILCVAGAEVSAWDNGNVCDFDNLFSHDRDLLSGKSELESEK